MNIPSEHKDHGKDPRLGFMGGGSISIHLFKELFSQPKLDIFRGVGYGLGDTKSADS